MIKETEIKLLQSISIKVREHIIRMATNGGCFIGASLSCTDIIVFLYFRFLNVNKDSLENPDRDYMFLSKGHDVPALYAVLAESGIIDKERLQNHLKSNDFIYWHPNTNIPGIEFHSGSLGHLLPVSVGVAIDCRLKSAKNKIVVIVGDGELNEGSNWEALLIAKAYKLDNLLIIVDRNHFQANKRTEDLIPLEPLEKKFEAFGCSCITINGHDFTDLDDAFMHFPFEPQRPSIIIADTTRGKGLPSIEEKADRWFCNFSKVEIDSLIKELHRIDTANINSEPLIVR